MERQVYHTNGTWIRNEFIPKVYDARLRSWYVQSLKYKTFSLTPLYVFAGESTVGLTATEPIWDPNNSTHMIGATCIDFDMNVLSNTFSKLQVSKTGWIVLLDSSFRLVASSFPIQSTVAKKDLDRLIDGEESIEPRVRMAVKALKGHGSSFEELRHKFQHGDNQFSTLFNLGMHRIIYNVADYYTLGMIPVIVVPESDFSFSIILGYIITFLFLLLVLALSVAFAFVFSLLIGIPLSKIMRLMTKAKNMKLTNLKPVWYVSILYEIRRIQSSFFVMVERLKEYRAFLPAEILAELDQKQTSFVLQGLRKGARKDTGFESETTDDTQSYDKKSNHHKIVPSVASAEGDNDKKDGKGNQIVRGRRNSGESVFSVQKSDKSSKQKTAKKLDALAIGLELMEGYTMVSLSWDNYMECVGVVGIEEFVKIHSKLLGIIQECGKKAHGVVDVKESGFDIYFPSASPKALSYAMRAADEIREKIANQGIGLSSEICKISMIYTVCTDSMIVGTIGTKDFRVKTRFGSCQNLNRVCQKLARIIGVNSVVCDRTQNALKRAYEFRPCGLTYVNGELRYLYVFDGKIDKQEDQEWMYKMEMEKKEQAKSDFALGFEALLTANFEDATKHFEAFLEIVNPNDTLAKILLEKTVKFASAGVDEDGVKNEMTFFA